MKAGQGGGGTVNGVARLAEGSQGRGGAVRWMAKRRGGAGRGRDALDS